MKIYRYISQKELDEIKNKKMFRLWQPKKWGLNESIITEVFGFNQSNKEYNLDKIKKRIKKFIISYMQSSDYKIPTCPFDTIYVPKKANAFDDTFYNVYTEISIMFNLSCNVFCSCWTTESNSYLFPQYKRGEKNVAQLISNSEIYSENIILFDLDGNEYKGILQTKQVVYKDFSYANSFDIIFNEFKKDRNLKTLFCTLQTNHIKQKEYRMIFTPDFLNAENVGSFSNFILSKYNKIVVGSLDDLVDALIERIKTLEKYINSIGSQDEEGNRFIYIDLTKHKKIIKKRSFCGIYCYKLCNFFNKKFHNIFKGETNV